MAAPDGRGRPAGLELRPGVLAQRLQQPVPRRAVGLLLHHHQRLVRQVREPLEDLLRRDPRTRTDVLGGFQRPAPGEHRERGEEGPLRRPQQLKAPVHGGPQRLLAGQRRAAALGQQAEAVLQPGQQLPRRQHAHPRRRQLDGQRDAVQPGTDLGHGRRVLGRHLERGLHRHRTVAEEPHRRVAGRRFDRSRLPEVWHGKRRHPPDDLTGDAQRLPAGGQEAQLGTGAQQGVSQPGAGIGEVLAVIEHQQQTPELQRVSERRRQRPAGGLTHAQGGSHRPGHEGGVGNGGQVDQPHAVWAVRQQAGRDPQRQPGLADAPGAAERHQAMLGQERPHGGALVLAPDEAGELDGQIVQAGSRRAEPRRVRAWAAGRGPGRRLEGAVLPVDKSQGAGEPGQGVPVGRPIEPALEVAHGARADPGALGQRLLRPAGPQPGAPEQGAEGRRVLLFHRAPSLWGSRQRLCPADRPRGPAKPVGIPVPCCCGSSWYLAVPRRRVGADRSWRAPPRASG